MKRSGPLKRRSGLKRGKGPRRITPARLARLQTVEPGEAEWKAPHRGPCGVCGKPGPLFRHHVFLEQTVRRAGGEPYNLRNSLDVGIHCPCHELHHNYGVNDRRFPLRRVPDDAFDFGVQLFGAGPAYEHLRRRYSGEDPRLEALLTTTEGSW